MGKQNSLAYIVSLSLTYVKVRIRLCEIVICALFFAMFDDLGLPKKDYETLRKRLDNEGYFFVTSVLPLLGKATEQGISNEKFSRPCNFKAAKESCLPAFLGGLFSRVFHTDGRLLDDADPLAVRSIRQVAYYCYKLDLPYDEAKNFTVINGFIATENEVKTLEFDSDAILTLSSYITKKIFSSLPSDVIPKHGPGVTSNVPISTKWDHRLTPNLPTYSIFGRYYFFNAQDGLDRLDRYPVYKNDTYFNHPQSAKVILVPKDSRGPRLISCEPAETQFIQQGIMRFMVDKLESHPLTAGHVNFTNQQTNRDMARIASEQKSWATLDLKEASDRCSLELVKKVFGKSPLLPYLLASRTSHTELPNGEKILLGKFAPMGSALCFPVMAYTLYVLMYVALLGIGVAPSDAKESIYVYGDDIIVPTQYANYLSEILSRYGFSINFDKSFIDSYFAESCGFDGFKGVDVTPVRLKKLWSLFEWRKGYPVALAPMVKHANNLNQLPSLRETVYALSELFSGPLPYGSTSSAYLCRTCEERDIFVLQSTWMSLNGMRGRRFKALTIVPDITSERSTTFWGHLYRWWSINNVEAREYLRFGDFNLPRQYKLRKRSYTF